MLVYILHDKIACLSLRTLVALSARSQQPLGEEIVLLANIRLSMTNALAYYKKF